MRTYCKKIGLLAIAPLALLGSCSSGSESALQYLGQPIVVGVPEVPAEFSPFSRRRNEADRLLLAMLFEGLYEPATSEGSLGTAARLAQDFPEPMNESFDAYSIRLREGARWNDGRTLTPEDVIASWRQVMDRENEYPGRAIVARYIESVRAGECATCLVVHLSRAVSPQDVPWLLTFPIAPAGSGFAEGMRSLPSWSRRPMGSGPFVLVGSLDANSPFVFLRRVIDSQVVLLRRIAGSMAQRVALDGDELDVLIEPDSVHAVRQRGYSQLSSKRPVSVALMLNPGNADMRFRAKRAEFLATVSEGLNRSGERCLSLVSTPKRASIRVSEAGSGVLIEDSMKALREALDCRGHKLTVLAQGRSGAFRVTPDLTAILLRLDDQDSDVGAIAAVIQSGAEADLAGLVKIYQEWLETPSPLGRRELRQDLFRLLESQALALTLGRRPASLLTHKRVSGVRFSEDGVVDGMSGWTWAQPASRP